MTLSKPISKGDHVSISENISPYVLLMNGSLYQISTIVVHKGTRGVVTRFWRDIHEKSKKMDFIEIQFNKACYWIPMKYIIFL